MTAARTAAFVSSRRTKLNRNCRLSRVAGKTNGLIRNDCRPRAEPHVQIRTAMLLGDLPVAAAYIEDKRAWRIFLRMIDEQIRENRLA